jgi:hypothetical protein
MIIVCKWCNQQFKARRRSSIYCSRKCQADGRSYEAEVNGLHDKWTKPEVMELALTLIEADHNLKRSKAKARARRILAMSTRPQGKRPQSSRRWNLKAVYGLSLEQYDQMLQAQDYVCAICKQSETQMFDGRIRPLSIDHDHENGQIRKLLCYRCNRAVALRETFYDYPFKKQVESYLAAEGRLLFINAPEVLFVPKSRY